MSTIEILRGAILYHSSSSTINELTDKPTYFTVDCNSWPNFSGELYRIIISKSLTIGICCEPSPNKWCLKSTIIDNNPSTKQERKDCDGLNDFDRYVIKICKDNNWDGILHSIEDGPTLEVILINVSIHEFQTVTVPVDTIVPSLDAIIITSPDPNHLEHIKKFRKNELSHRSWYYKLLKKYIELESI